MLLVEHAIDAIGQRGQIVDDQIRRDIGMRPVRLTFAQIVAMHPRRAQAGARGAEHIHLDVIADMQHFVRRAAQALAGGMENAGVGFGRAVFLRAELKREVMIQTDHGQVRIAVAQRHDR